MADKDEGLNEDMIEQESGGEGQSLKTHTHTPLATMNGGKSKKCTKPDIDSLVTQAVNSAFQNHLQDFLNACDKRPKHKRHSSNYSSSSDSLDSDSSSEKHSSRCHKTKDKSQKRGHPEPPKKSKKKSRG